jgi:2-amino-4-hydroxy-6-hydroxymethyldihydropteridine diphosphokinase
MSESAWVTTYIGLGSNLDEPLQQVKSALIELARLPETRCVQHSSLYRTAPVGPPDQPDFINAVAKLETGLGPESLLDALQRIEQNHLRVRQGPRWGPRTLDLDLLLYGTHQLATARLQIPHPHLTQRAFVLLPLAEVASRNLQIPGVGALAQLLDRVSDDGVQRLQ